MKAHPRAISRISHHWSGRLTTVVLLEFEIGVSMPVMVGSGVPDLVLEAGGRRQDQRGRARALI